MLKTTVTLVTSLAFTTAFANDYMAATEVKALMHDRTFDGVFLAKNKHFTAYEAPDGTHHVRRANGKLDKGRTWFVNDQGQHCTTHPKWKKKWPDGRCSYLKDAGNGEFHKINDKGKHTHTLTNFRDGNQL